MKTVSLELICNFNEALVRDYLAQKYGDDKELADLENGYEDVACIALNQLPPNYVKHRVDKVFYTSEHDRLELEKFLRVAVDNAVVQVKKTPKISR